VALVPSRVHSSCDSTGASVPTGRGLTASQSSTMNTVNSIQNRGLHNRPSSARLPLHVSLLS